MSMETSFNFLYNNYKYISATFGYLDKNLQLNSETEDNSKSYENQYQQVAISDCEHISKVYICCDAAFLGII